MKTIECPKCSKDMEIPEHYLNKSVKCVSCGSQFEAVEKVEAPKIKESAFCRECGTEMSKKAVACPKCGAPTENKNRTTVIEETSKKIKIHIIAATSIFLLGALLVVIAVFNGSTSLGGVGWSIFQVGLVYLLVAKFIQWWKHK
jgi:uncharacterized membrane protein YvbJ